MVIRSPPRTSCSQAIGPITQPEPMVVAPRSTDIGRITESGPTATPASTNVVAGSSTVTPPSISASRVRRRSTPSAVESWRRSLMPSDSLGSVARIASTAPSKSSMTSVR